MALRCHFPPERIIFHGNNKTPDELALAVESGVGRIVVDNALELERLIALAEGRAGGCRSCCASTRASARTRTSTA